MKILYFHQHFTTPTQAGGTRSYELAQRLIAKGHSVCMVCGETAKLSLPETNVKGIHQGMIDGIRVIQIALPYSNKDGIDKRAWTFLKFAWRGISIALKEDYDLLFATSTPLTAGIPGIVMKLFRKKKFVFEVRDLWPELPKALGMRNPFWLWGMSALEWLSYHCADACIGLSPGICVGIKKRSQINKPIAMIPNGCDLEIFKPSLRDNLLLEGVKPTDKVVIFTGAHGVANGLDAILDAVDMGLIHGTSGNIAMRDDKEDVVAITPSGISYKGMTADQIAIVDMNGKWLDGPFKPSSEVPMHTAVMRARKDVKATVHTHGMFATIAAMSGELLPITPPQAEFVPVGIVPFTMPGSNDVADKVVEALGEEGRAVLIKNHGMFCCGKDMKAAMAATIYTEEMAQTTYYAKVAGVYQPMPEEAVKKMKELIAADQAAKLASMNEAV